MREQAHIQEPAPTKQLAQTERLLQKPTHMGHPVGWEGPVYEADAEITGREHATQTPLRGEKGEEEFHEWHYVHLTTEDGDIIVIGFFTKELLAAAMGPSSIKPGVSVDCVMKDGTVIDTLEYYDNYDADHDKLDIHMGESWIKAVDDDVNAIQLHVKSGDVELDVIIDRTVPAFRNDTGKTIFGDGTKWEAWDVIMPSAITEGDIAIKGKTCHIKGKAYVDHAYGNEMFGVHHWYWNTVDIGPYTFITSANYTADKHMLREERDHIVAFMMAKDGKIIGKDSDKVQFVPGPKKYDKEMRRHVAKEMEYIYTDGNMQYILKLKHKKKLLVKPMAAMVVKNRLVQKLAYPLMLGGPYLRAVYDAWLEVYRDGTLVEAYVPEDSDEQPIGEIFNPGGDEPAPYPTHAREHRDMITLFQDR
jgi:hypothetical protein